MTDGGEPSMPQHRNKLSGDQQPKQSNHHSNAADDRKELPQRPVSLHANADTATRDEVPRERQNESKPLQ